MIILIILLIATWQWITFGFVNFDEKPAEPSPETPLALLWRS